MMCRSGGTPATPARITTFSQPVVKACVAAADTQGGSGPQHTCSDNTALRGTRYQ